MTLIRVNFDVCKRAFVKTLQLHNVFSMSYAEYEINTCKHLASLQDLARDGAAFYRMFAEASSGELELLEYIVKEKGMQPWEICNMEEMVRHIREKLQDIQDLFRPKHPCQDPENLEEKFDAAADAGKDGEEEKNGKKEDGVTPAAENEVKDEEEKDLNAGKKGAVAKKNLKKRKQKVRSGRAKARFVLQQSKDEKKKGKTDEKNGNSNNRKHRKLRESSKRPKEAEFGKPLKAKAKANPKRKSKAVEADGAKLQGKDLQKKLHAATCLQHV